MEALNLLRSPYAQELPLDLIDDSVPNAKQDAERGGGALDPRRATVADIPIGCGYRHRCATRAAARWC